MCLRALIIFFFGLLLLRLSGKHVRGRWGAFASGTIVNPLTAHSQYMGGMIWGRGAALEEKPEIDLAHARYVKDNIAEYHVPVNADVERLDVIVAPETDQQVNPLGIKGIGEIGIVGMNAAIANAVWHAASVSCRSVSRIYSDKFRNAKLTVR